MSLDVFVFNNKYFDILSFFVCALHLLVNINHLNQQFSVKFSDRNKLKATLECLGG